MVYCVLIGGMSVSNVNDLEAAQITALLNAGMRSVEVARELGVEEKRVEIVEARQLEEVAPGDLSDGQLKLLTDQLFQTAITHPDANVRTKVALKLYESNRVSQESRAKNRTLSGMKGNNILVVQQTLDAATRRRDAHES